jgi:hypothetical protein
MNRTRQRDDAVGLRDDSQLLDGLLAAQLLDGLFERGCGVVDISRISQGPQS